MESPELVVYDLDGVITRKDTFTALIVRRLARSPVRLLRALLATTTLLTGPKARASRKIAEVALTGMTDDGYSTLAEQLGRKFANDPRWMRTEAVERIRRQYESGARIVIATATERRLAQALLGGANVPYHLLSASLLEAAPSGLVVADHRVGVRKKEALFELEVPIARAEFVTDSMTDLPTAEAAAKVVLIGASERTTRRFAGSTATLADEH